MPVDLIKDINGKYHVNMVSVENIEKKVSWVYADVDAQQDGRAVNVIGYGKLKIMSDKDIEEFKQKYLDYLQKNGVTDLSYDNTGIKDDGGIDMHHDKTRAFKNKLSDGFFSRYYWKDLFKDKNLKVSKCDSKCQAWGGNSGGPVIDNRNRLFGVFTRLYYTIGGENHAEVLMYVTMAHVFNKMNKVLTIGP